MSARKISDKNHNDFLKEGIEKHRPTNVVPEKMLLPWSADLADAIERKQQVLVDSLKRHYQSPFFEAPGFVLFNGDCSDLLGALKEARISIDLCLTSPPYNIGKEYEDIVAVSDYVEWCSCWMTQVYEVTSPQGAFWLNVGYLEVPKAGLCVPIPYLLWDKSPFYLLQEVVWQYGAGVSTKKRLSPRNEKWLFYVRNPRDYVFHLDDIRDPNVKYPNQKKNGKYRCNPLGKNPSDVWSMPKVTTGKNRSSRERTAHPAQFPLQVVERIVLASSTQQQIVLDPFAGSCSTGIASAGLGRLFVGIEMDRDYCKMAVERFQLFMEQRKARAAQPFLF